MGGSQPIEHCRRAPRESRRQSQKQLPLAAESLHKQTCRNARMSGDVRQREFMWTALVHGPLRGVEDLVVADLPAASPHKLVALY